MGDSRQSEVLAMKANLPAANPLNVGALSAIFDSTSTSYKPLFFIGLLQLIESRMRRLDSNREFALNEITSSLLSFGWYPHRFFKLSFGLQDQVGEVLDHLVFDLSEHAVTRPSAHQTLQRAIAKQFDLIGAAKLQRYVPQRLLTPFFADELRGLPDHKKDAIIRDLADATFVASNPPLYRFIQGGTHIEIHPRWLDYVKRNFAIVKGWAFNHWALYLQTKNPNAPAIIQKIAPPNQRVSLESQRKVWKHILVDLAFDCIYSDKPINRDRFDLDHFLPWSFTCHNQYWNLIPSEPSENRSMGRTLPTPGQVEAFIQVQLQALQVARRRLSAKQWSSFSEDYRAGLGLTEAGLLCSNKVRVAYTNTLNPLISLAQSFGY